MKLAICQVADAGPLDSLAIMLRAAGYEVRIPGLYLREMLKSYGCDTVLDPVGLHQGMGYDPVDYPQAQPSDLADCDLYVDIKAQRNGPKIWRQWPRLQSRTLWYRINGGEPEITERGGDEINPGCPILTANMWYRANANWGGQAYACWPPFAQWDKYQGWRKQGDSSVDHSPICLIHNLEGWGMGRIAELLRPHGVKFYGDRSPNGLVQHSETPRLLDEALCYLSLRTNDCPGYSMYEAMAAGCPMIVPRRLIERMKMHDLLIDGETCLGFGGPEQDQWGGKHAELCAAEILKQIEALSDRATNSRIGRNARYKLRELLWNEARDGDSFAGFMNAHFGAVASPAQS